MLRRFLVILVTAILVLVSMTAATSGNRKGGHGGNQRVFVKTKMFGRNHRFDKKDLPSSRMRSRLYSLPAFSERRAMDWLHRFDFPEKDVDSILIDDDGGVLYADSVPADLPQESEQADATGSEAAQPAATAAADAFLLHSRPGAQSVVYLDFDGHVFSTTAWSNSTLHAKPFDLDGSASTFSDGERAAIAEIWHRVAEDFAAFDIDVTTEEPSTFGPYVGRVLITSRNQTNGQLMPYPSSGGVAYVGVWGELNYHSFYSPALVYYDNLASASNIIAETCSHEFGHNLGLTHDGTGSTTYYAGHGSGATSWAPIMGTSFSKNVTQWSRGEYAGANNDQDDLAIIADQLGLVADDHGDVPSQSTPLVLKPMARSWSATPKPIRTISIRVTRV